MRLLFLCILCYALLACKKHKRMDIEGTVTDVYTGEPVPNVEVRLQSLIETSGTITTDKKEYFTFTDANGKYKFMDAYFSKPEFSGQISVADMNAYITETQGSISEDDSKLLGQPALVRDITVRCNARVVIRIIFQPHSNAVALKISPKFEGTRSLGALDDFGSPFVPRRNEVNSLVLAGDIVGYPDGKTIFRVEHVDVTGKTFKTEFDTLVAAGCGTINEYLIIAD